ncbi:Flp family type IVb pilin [Arthrobacter sp. MSA 4-2]|uniref:Flp family type IVb pilin n=1 Tax=Arthrobacter sp. MSA 4-2 TaxID=2794349 RepID=UPI0018E87086|nr:Flp family type IVb pilin [Arthrobacter sp. MSA 4-2]MBJ2120510.1 Flp family type IVb pilin [Arthrobacter sp. MSA 4-2]
MLALFATVQSVLHTAKARLVREEKGATMVEYGIMVAFIAIVVLAVVILLGPEIAALFQRVRDAI